MFQSLDDSNNYGSFLMTTQNTSSAFSQEPVGFSTFFLPAFISHDCRPNCMWHYEGDSFILRARTEVCVTMASNLLAMASNLKAFLLLSEKLQRLKDDCLAVVSSEIHTI